MSRIATVLTLLFMLPASLAFAAGDRSAPAPDAKTFRWAAKCNEIPSPHIAVCRIVPDVEQGVIRRGPFVPLTFQIDNQKGRTVSVDGGQNCLEQPAVLHFGQNEPFTIRPNDSLSGAVFDRVIAEFRAAKSGTLDYSPLPDCKRVTATFYYSNLDDVLANALERVGSTTN